MFSAFFPGSSFDIGLLDLSEYFGVTSLTIGSGLTSSGPDLFFIDDLSYEVAAVPLPAALPLLAYALAGMGFFGWRRRRQSV